MKDGNAEVALETEVKIGEHGVERDRRVCVRARKEYSGRWSMGVEKVYYMSNVGVSGR